MLGLYSFLFPWNFVIQGIAIIHFIRRRPDTYWLYIILIGGALGSLVYISVEVLPDFGLLRDSFKVFPRRKRIRELEATVLDNPSAGNYEELADLYRLLERHSRRTQCASQRANVGYEGTDISYRLLLRDTGRVDDLVSELKSFPGVSRVTSLKAEDESEV